MSDVSEELLKKIMFLGVGLAIGGLIVGSIFASSVTTFTDAFSGLNTTGTNITSAIGNISDVVPIVWILSFLMLFLVVALSAFKVRSG